MSKENFFDCPRVTKAIDVMKKGKASLEELDVTAEEIALLCELGINIVNIPQTDIYYIDNTHESLFEIISFKSKNKKIVRWVEIGALFAGHRSFDKKALIKLLNFAKERGYTQVHFSGDLCAGPPPKPTSKKNSNWNLWEKTTSVTQADLITSILSQFPDMTFYAINGENELAFERREQLNPLFIVQRDLRSKGIDFIFKPTMTLNLVVEGLVQRIVYLKRKRTYTSSYQSEFYMDEQYIKMVDNVVIKGKNYKLMAVQFGGAMENSLNKNGSTDSPIYMTTNSGFVRDTLGEFSSATTYPSIRFCEATIQNAKLISNLKTCLRFEA